jgi:hypothetical protein
MVGARLDDFELAAEKCLRVWRAAAGFSGCMFGSIIVVSPHQSFDSTFPANKSTAGA